MVIKFADTFWMEKFVEKSVAKTNTYDVVYAVYSVETTVM